MKHFLFLFFVLLISYKSIRSQCSVQITLSQTDCFQINNNIVAANTSGQPPFTYLWYNGDTTSMSDSIPFGDTVSVTITDNLGCVASDIRVLPNFNGYFNCYTQIVNNASCISGMSICCDGSMVVHALDSLSLCPVDQYIVGGGFIAYCTGSTTHTYYTDTIINLAQATYTITPMSSCGCMYYSTNFTMPGNTTVSVSNNNPEVKKFRIQPNPNNGEFTLNVNSEATSVKIYTMEGVQIADFSLPLFEKKPQVSLKNLLNGIYFVKLFEKDMVVGTDRFVILK